jgi:hypothetical protein
LSAVKDIIIIIIKYCLLGIINNKSFKRLRRVGSGVAGSSNRPCNGQQSGQTGFRPRCTAPRDARAGLCRRRNHHHRDRASSSKPLDSPSSFRWPDRASGH